MAHYIVLATVMDDDESLFGALRAGAQGYLLKEHLRGDLVEQLRGIVEGRPPLSPSIARRILGHFHPDPHARQLHLTPREAQVLTLIAQGATRKGIARQLALSPNTVSGYIKTICQKLNIRSCSEAIRAVGCYSHIRAHVCSPIRGRILFHGSHLRSFSRPLRVVTG